MSGGFIILYVPTSSDNFLLSRKWLTVDLEHKRLYCFPCLIFAKKRKGPWVDSGFIKLSYLLGALEKHEGQEHCDAIIEQKLFLKRTSHLEVGTAMDPPGGEGVITPSGFTRRVSDGSQTGLRQVSDRSQTGLRRVSDGSQTGLRRVSDRSQTGLRRVSDGSQTGLRRVSDGSQTGLRRVSDGSQMG